MPGAHGCEPTASELAAVLVSGCGGSKPAVSAKAPMHFTHAASSRLTSVRRFRPGINGCRPGGEQSGFRADHLLEQLGLADRREHLPRRLSGGEAQRVALAVALANAPDLLLADEVVGEQDSATAERVMELIFETSRERGLAVLLVTHSLELAARTQHQLRLVDGEVHRT